MLRVHCGQEPGLCSVSPRGWDPWDGRIQNPSTLGTESSSDCRGRAGPGAGTPDEHTRERGWGQYSAGSWIQSLN